MVKETSTYTTAATINEDYVAAYNSNNELEISILDDGALANKTSVYIAYDKLDPSRVTENEVIGGVNSSGEVKGLELVDMVYTQYGVLPGAIAAPNWSDKPLVAVVMRAKARKVSGLFPCIAYTDIDTAQCRNYINVNTWKNNNGYNGANEYVGWPCFNIEGKIIHASTHAMGVIGVMDEENEDIPYMSPSNHQLQASGMCLKDGTEIMMTLDQANLLNDQGVFTGLNFNGGWKLWGNYTAAYPGNTDPKDYYLCCRRMFDWQQKTFILNYWQNVDQPLIPRLVRSIVDSESIRLNGLVARGYLLAADIKFYEEENPKTDLLAGKLKVHVFMTPPVPAQSIEEVVEYDVTAYSNIFAEFEG